MPVSLQPLHEIQVRKRHAVSVDVATGIRRQEQLADTAGASCLRERRQLTDRRPSAGGQIELEDLDGSTHATAAPQVQPAAVGGPSDDAVLGLEPWDGLGL